MKLSKNSLLSAATVIAVAIGCAGFMDKTPGIVSETPPADQIQTRAEAEVFNRSHHVEDIITIRPR